MTLLRMVFLSTAMIAVTGVPAVRAEDRPAQPNGAASAEQPPAIHCQGQNCLPPAEDPVLDCKGPDCTPAPPSDQTPSPEIKKVK